jgi:hypothetical protein
MNKSLFFQDVLKIPINKYVRLIKKCYWLHDNKHFGVTPWNLDKLNKLVDDDTIFFVEPKQSGDESYLYGYRNEGRYMKEYRINVVPGP